MKRNYLTAALSSLLMAAVLLPTAAAQSAPEKAGKAEMQERYERAKTLIRGTIQHPYKAKDLRNQLIVNEEPYPHWIGDEDIFWYARDVKNNGDIYREIRLVDANKKTNKPAFDHKRFAEALSKASGTKLGAKDIKFADSMFRFGNIGDVSITFAPYQMHFKYAGKNWLYAVKNNKVKEVQKAPKGDMQSPDGTQIAFIKNYNVWLRDAKSGVERALTTDGAAYFAYGGITGPSAEWTSLYFPMNASWSADGKKLLVIQNDARLIEGVEEATFVHADGSLYPKVQKIRQGTVGDEHVGEARYVAIDVETGEKQCSDYRTMPYTMHHITPFQRNLAWWGKDSHLAYFLDTGRYYKSVRLVQFDTHTGATKVLFEETSDTRVKLTQQGEEEPTTMVLPETDELLWYSERSGWGHLYLYDLKTGKLKNAVTQGDYVVRNIVRYDAKHRELYLQTNGRVKGRNPYYRDLVRVNIDTGKMVTLASSDHDVNGHSPQNLHTYEMGGHGVNGVSVSGNYAVYSKSRVNTAPVSYVVDRSGKTVMELETADISKLPKGWQWPEPVQTVAADGKTDIYGVVYRPADFDPKKSYPVISHVMNTPRYAITPRAAFGTGSNWNMLFPQALAELGFIVVQFDGRGTPYRSKAFADHSYGWFDSASELSDHVAGIKQLAKRYSYIDIDRAGIYSSMWGQGAVLGMLQHPDFYKVGVEGFYADDRVMLSMHTDRYNGPKARPDRKTPTELVGNLKGKLLLMTTTNPGYFSGFSTLAGTFQLMDALQAANKDFDTVVEQRVGWLRTSYQERRAWDYFVRHLQGNEPPKEFVLDGTPFDR
ncbi:S9 family peptidase [Paremcibacter congregatus]|nr:DPP IV N-terminal domain-containing protein [Paremcibacter congregatus]